MWEIEYIDHFTGKKVTKRFFSRVDFMEFMRFSVTLSVSFTIREIAA